MTMTGITGQISNEVVPGNILLNILRRNKGKWVSGEALATHLSLTRSAIWKQVGILKKEGYEIESLPRRGYRLLAIPDLLLVQEIQDQLETADFGRGEIHRYVKTDSTNNQAKELAARGAAHGILVIAEEQTRGRGRLDRTWFSPREENICASLIMRPSLSPGMASRLVLLCAVAAAETLTEAIGLKANVKWPNDILVGGRKIGGILLEMAVEMDAIDYMVVGFGLNVNSPAERFPKEIRSNTTSIFMETGKPFSRVVLLCRFLKLLEDRYSKFLETGFESVISQWKELTDMVGKRASIRTINGLYNGEIVDLDHNGFLVLRNNQEGEIRLFSGDITII
jgi:BirA family transcriptional regulator, biotin operon repressor / biotin---[acetyl-CoA-carboxylase] ligase